MICFSDNSGRRSGRRRIGAAVLVAAGAAWSPGRSSRRRSSRTMRRRSSSACRRATARRGTTIRALHAALAANPADASAAAELARRYLELNRSVGDPRLVAYASRALAPWDGVAAPPVDVALERALIAQTEHRFDAARVELLRSLERSPRSAQAWLALAALDTVQGRYAGREARVRAARLAAGRDRGGRCFAARAGA